MPNYKANTSGDQVRYNADLKELRRLIEGQSRDIAALKADLAQVKKPSGSAPVRPAPSPSPIAGPKPTPSPGTGTDTGALTFTGVAKVVAGGTFAKAVPSTGGNAGDYVPPDEIRMSDARQDILLNGVSVAEARRRRFNFVNTPSLIFTITDVPDDDQIDIEAEAVTESTSGGTVTSVNLTAPATVFNVGGVPFTTNGTIALSFVPQSANTAFMGPVSGAAAAPTFRALVDADIPAILSANARLAVRRNSTGTTVGPRRRLNLVEGQNVHLVINDDSVNEEVDVQISADSAPLATSSVSGTVKTDVTQSDPIVPTNTTYLANKASTDATTAEVQAARQRPAIGVFAANLYSSLGAGVAGLWQAMATAYAWTVTTAGGLTGGGNVRDNLTISIATAGVTTAKIADANVTPAKLAPGGTTPDATKYYRGDGTWQAVSSSGGSALTGTQHNTTRFNGSGTLVQTAFVTNNEATVNINPAGDTAAGGDGVTRLRIKGRAPGSFPNQPLVYFGTDSGSDSIPFPPTLPNGGTILKIGDVSGDAGILLTQNGSAGLYLANRWNGNNPSGSYLFIGSPSPSRPMMLSPYGGNVGIGEIVSDTTPRLPTEKLEVYGNMLADGYKVYDDGVSTEGLTQDIVIGGVTLHVVGGLITGWF